MNLQGSITDLQNTVVKLYLDLEQRFKENQLIRDLWTAMAHDITQQKLSLTMLPSSFWHKLKAEQDGVAAALAESALVHESGNKGDASLKSCFERTMLLEEQTILKIYVPIIRKLRENWTDQALDFYIVVKAHLARITRVTQAFAGDPVIIQRSSLLLQRFEKEVQEPQIVVKPKLNKAHAVQHAQEKHSTMRQKKAIPKQAAAIAKRAKIHHKRAKPLVENISLQRRRVRR
jgi:hypothetical protein